MGCNCCVGPTDVLQKHLFLDLAFGSVRLDEVREPAANEEHEKDDEDDASDHGDIDNNASED